RKPNVQYLPRERFATLNRFEQVRIAAETHIYEVIHPSLCIALQSFAQFTRGRLRARVCFYFADPSSTASRPPSARTTRHYRNIDNRNEHGSGCARAKNSCRPIGFVSRSGRALS